MHNDRPSRSDGSGAELEREAQLVNLECIGPQERIKIVRKRMERKIVGK